MTGHARRPRRFTGRHMAAIITIFFAIVIAVNVTMATLASRTFGGTVVDNSYVAGQRFNDWLRAAREQQTLGWQAAVQRRGDGRVEVNLSGPAGPLAGARLGVDARHRFGREPDTALAMREVAPGRFLSDQPLPAGRWQLILSITAEGRDARLMEAL